MKAVVVAPQKPDVQLTLSHEEAVRLCGLVAAYSISWPDLIATLREALKNE